LVQIHVFLSYIDVNSQGAAECLMLPQKCEEGG
jgi:hypothetical protein